MAPRHSSVSDAYSTLGLEQGASLETVKTAYKQLALRTHPDKNQNNPDATVQFQKISGAYNVLLNHLDTSTPPPMPHGFTPFHAFHPHPHPRSCSRSHSRGPGYEDDEEEDESEYEYYDSDEFYEEEEEDLNFFRFLFEELLHGRANRFAGARFQARPREHDAETEEQYQARMRRQREEQAAAAQRRKAQEDAWKQRRQMEREDEVRAGEERRRQKAEAKKAEAAAARRSAAQTVRSRQQKSQMLRSAVFAAAREGDAAKVKNAVWEEGVDAAGGEVKPGMEDFVQRPVDPRETLLHLAVARGDADLVGWLDRHNAEADERDSQKRTAFHLALQHGHVTIIRYFFAAYPPQDSDSGPVLRSAGKPLLRLALDSGEPEVVWFVLDAGLADSKAVLETWTWICGNEGQARKQFGSVGKREKGLDEDKFEETRELLMSWGGFTPPRTPRCPPAEVHVPPQPKMGKRNKRQTPTPPRSPPTSSPMPTPPPSHHSPPGSPVTQGAGRTSAGQRRDGKGRGRGRGRGRGAPPSHTHA